MSENGQTSPRKRATLQRMKNDDAYFEALKTRDHRFDGKFFVGVKTTGIYCRPVCPAKPKRENVEFFASQIEAETAGYRPCLRCRPESAPRSPAWIGTSAIVQRAVKRLAEKDVLDLNEDEFAAKFGISARHLRRLFIDEIGKTPKQLAFENRLNLARKLLSETGLSAGEVAFASGFESIRRFNAAFKDRFKRSPSEVRRTKAPEGVQVKLSYRPPFDYAGLIKVYKAHAIGELEWFEGETMYRVVEFDGKVGTIAISNDQAKSLLNVKIDFPDLSKIYAILARVRAMFDLDSDPVLIANAFEVDKKLHRLIEKHPGLRLPSGWDPLEIAIGTILGQLVSVDRGRALTGELIKIANKKTVRVGGRDVHLFPTPAQIAKANLEPLKSTGMRKRTLKEFSKAIANATLSLEPTQDVETFIERLQDIPGIGAWTATYMAMKCLRHTDSFPGTDLILARALDIHPQETIDKVRPWRGYAAALLWKEYAEELSKKGKQNGTVRSQK